MVHCRSSIGLMLAGVKLRLLPVPSCEPSETRVQEVVTVGASVSGSLIDALQVTVSEVVGAPGVMLTLLTTGSLFSVVTVALELAVPPIESVAVMVQEMISLGKFR